MAIKSNTLGTGSLLLLCLGSMIGAGLFALPQNLALTASLPALLGAWLITFSGMYALVRVFQTLALRAPHLDSGIYAYARAALGDYIGFNAAWGYWISIIIGNVGYLIIFCSALNLFFPGITQGGSLIPLFIGSFLIWGTTALCLCGINTAAIVNNLITIVKILPILLFAGFMVKYCKLEMLTQNWFCLDTHLGSLTQQITHTMLTTIWVFVGIEGASVMSERARKREDIGRATVLSFVVMLLLLIAVSVFPYGVLPRHELAELAEPSTGALLNLLIGVKGNVLINLALIVAILGGFLSWMLLAAEVPQVAARQHQLFPAYFARFNQRGAPIGAMILSAILEQLYLFAVYLLKLSYLNTILIASAMIVPPYLFSAWFAFNLSRCPQNYRSEPRRVRIKELITSIIAILFCVWLCYAAGIYLALTALFYLLGLPLYLNNRRCLKKKFFTKSEKFYISILVVIALGSYAYFLR